MASAAQRKVVMVRADSRHHIIARKRKFSAAQQHVATMALRSIEEGCIVEEIFPNAGAVGFRLMDLSAVGHVLKLEKTVAREVGSAAVAAQFGGHLHGNDAMSSLVLFSRMSMEIALQSTAFLRR